MAAAPLNPLPSSIGIVSSCIATSTTTLSLIPTSLWQKNYTADVNLVSTASNSSTHAATKLFSIARSPEKMGITSHEISDNNGTRLLELGVKKGRWIVRVPSNQGDDKGYRELGTALAPKDEIPGFWKRRKLDWTFALKLTMKNEISAGEEVTINIRSKNNTNSSFDVFVNGNVAMRVKRTSDAVYPESPSWDFEVAKGFDISLVR